MLHMFQCFRVVENVQTAEEAIAYVQPSELVAAAGLDHDAAVGHLSLGLLKVKHMRERYCSAGKNMRNWWRF